MLTSGGNFPWIPPEEAGLTEREREILRLVAEGLANKEIAYRLGISQNTVKVHLRNIFAKANLQSRTEAAMYAVRFGLATVPISGATGVAPEAEEEEEAAAEALSGVGEAPLEAPAPAGEVFPAWKALVLLVGLMGGLALALGPAPSPPAAPGPAFLEDGAGRGTARQGLPSRWRVKSQMPTPRARFALAAWRGLLIAIGGEAPEGITDRVERYDRQREVWERGAPKPFPVANMAAGVLGDRIVVPGGVGPQGQPTDRVEIYDPRADRWTEGPPLPYPLSAYALAVAEGRLYLFGGWDGRRLRGEVWMLDGESGFWQPRAPMPTPRAFAAAATLGDAIYVVGGYDGQQELTVCERYRFAVDRWERCPSLNVGRGGLSLVASDGYLFALGGGWRIPLAFNERYQPGAEAWVPFETPVTGTWRNMGAVAEGGSIWILGGWSGEPMATLWQFTPFPFRLFLPSTQR